MPEYNFHIVLVVHISCNQYMGNVANSLTLEGGGRWGSLTQKREEEDVIGHTSKLDGEYISTKDELMN